MSTIFITAYKDIGRRTWKSYQRSQEQYIDVFVKMALEISKNYTLIVYCSKEVENECMMMLKTKYNMNEFSSNVIFVDIEQVTTFYNKYIDIERKIISSDEYKRCIPMDRKTNPEHVYAEYNLINHSKVNFVADAKKRYNDYEYYVWVDFGLNDYPTKELNISKICQKNKIVYGLNTLLYEGKIDARNMLASHIIFFMGSEFVVHRGVVELFEKVYEETLLELYKENVSDDDQNVVLQIYYRNKDLFQPIYVGQWFSLFKKFLNK